MGYDFFQEELFNGNHVAYYSTDFLFDKGTEFIENSLKSGENFAVVLSIPDPHCEYCNGLSLYSKVDMTMANMFIQPQIPSVPPMIQCTRIFILTYLILGNER